MPREGEEESEDERPLSMNALVICEKPGHGVLVFGVTICDGEVIIQKASYCPSADIAMMKTAEAEWKGRSLYCGPKFLELEEDLQITFREYIEVRGINSTLAAFLDRFIVFGEQKEHIAWLQRVKDYVNAR
ncbi:MAG: mitochondrial glycoprotein [Olpidium bornovanus]|uniref:Mitochondrial glycoprotein n=1 Tax=Olpidium bornovanus TaxID=278681 RepID=A0A8H8DLL8_9FUNG|nr:MAG: mitochondrial glycoprotein [Olpidium bornovanus]